MYLRVSVVVENRHVLLDVMENVRYFAFCFDILDGYCKKQSE